MNSLSFHLVQKTTVHVSGEFYTPRCVVKLLVEMLEPYRGRVYDPCCGSSGMFVQSVEFIRAHATGNGNGGRAPKVAKADISIYGQESNYTTWRLELVSKMVLWQREEKKEACEEKRLRETEEDLAI